MKMKTALTIAGSDSGGGAGIQADIKTMMANGVYAMSAITALTAQNTTKSSRYYGRDTTVSGRAAGLHFTDIRPDAVKTGMVASAALIRTIAGKLTEYQAVNIVVDPVMVSTSGARLISEEAIETLKEKLFPLATVITPNIPEAEVLADMEIETVQDMEKAAEVIGTRYGCSVLLKGGHQKNGCQRICSGRRIRSRCGSMECRIDNPNTHGTGCTLSSAIASNLAKGRDLETSGRGGKTLYFRGTGSDAGSWIWQWSDESWICDKGRVVTWIPQKENNKMNNHSIQREIQQQEQN